MTKYAIISSKLEAGQAKTQIKFTESKQEVDAVLEKKINPNWQKEGNIHVYLLPNNFRKLNKYDVVVETYKRQGSIYGNVPTNILREQIEKEGIPLK